MFCCSLSSGILSSSLPGQPASCKTQFKPSLLRSHPYPKQMSERRNKQCWSLKQKWLHLCKPLLCGSLALEHFLHCIEVTCFLVCPPHLCPCHTYTWSQGWKTGNVSFIGPSTNYTQYLAFRKAFLIQTRSISSWSRSCV